MKLINIVKEHGYIQDYSSTLKIKGVKLIDIRNFVGDEGDFCEIIRIDKKGRLEALLPDFEFFPRQINRSASFPGIIKAWHYHYRQNEIWYVPPSDQLFVGLWDLREESGSAGVRMRMNLGGGASKLLFIPAGVAHGYANFSSHTANLNYICDQQFDLENLDENRISFDFDTDSRSFWTPERD